MLSLVDIQPQKNEIYLDNNATTPVLPQAAEAAMHAMQLCYGNPSSSHITGLQAKYMLESTRTLIRQVVGAHQGELIFTSGATEGIQTAIISALNHAKARGINHERPVLLYGATEHKAVPETLKHWNEVLDIYADVVAIPVDSDGILDHHFIAEHIDRTVLICTMAVNNETGVYQDLKALEQVIRGGTNADVLWMVDCVQALGKCSLALSSSSIDYALFSGHKLYAMKGVGVLYIRKGAPYTAFIAGGGQESGLRSGTENLPGIASLNAIFALLADKNNHTFKSAEVLNGYRKQLAETLKTVFPKIVFNHSFEYSVPTTLNFSVQGLSASDIMDLFDAAGIRVSSGSACSSKVTGSFVLDAMGKPRWQSEGAIRLSFGPAATQAEIDAACQAISTASKALQNACLLISETGHNDASKPVDGLQLWRVNERCCWFYADTKSKECVLIDPLPEIANKFETLVTCQGYQVKAILDSYRTDYRGSCRQMLCRVINRNMDDVKNNQLGWPEQSKMTSLDNQLTVPYLWVGDKVLAKMSFPGHTENSQVFLLGTLKNDKLSADNIDYVFTGPSVMPGALGKTDLESSLKEQFFESLQNLDHVITRKTPICPGEDPRQYFVTSLQLEMRAVPLLAKVLLGDSGLEAFLREKNALDAGILGDVAADKSGCERIVYHDLTPGSWHAFVEQHRDLMILDVREPYEFDADTSDCFSQRQRLNVPLSQLTAFMSDNAMAKDEPIVCLCRSGNRSAIAAKALARYGYQAVYHVPGGMALIE